jgi:ABC-type anion transport system duplicated permease subunit
VNAPLPALVLQRQQHQAELVRHVRRVDIEVVFELTKRLVVLQAALDEAIVANQLLAVTRRHLTQRTVHILRQWSIGENLLYRIRRISLLIMLVVVAAAVVVVDDVAKFVDLP